MPKNKNITRNDILMPSSISIADTIHFRTAYKKIVRLFIKKYEHKYLKNKKISEEFKTILCFHIVKKQES